MKRTLTLKRETLTELTTADLTAVAGAAPLSGPTCPIQTCLCISNIGECVTYACNAG